MQSAVSDYNAAKLRRFRTLQLFVPESFIASAQYASVNGFTFTFGGLDLHLVDWNYTWWNWFASGGIGITFATFVVNYVGQEKEAGFAS